MSTYMGDYVSGILELWKVTDEWVIGTALQPPRSNSVKPKTNPRQTSPSQNTQMPNLALSCSKPELIRPKPVPSPVTPKKMEAGWHQSTPNTGWPIITLTSMVSQLPVISSVTSAPKHTLKTASLLGWACTHAHTHIKNNPFAGLGMWPCSFTQIKQPETGKVLHIHTALSFPWAIQVSAMSQTAQDHITSQMLGLSQSHHSATIKEWKVYCEVVPMGY